MLREIKEVCGKVLGCRFKAPNQYEVTMSTAKGKGRLIDGFKIKSCRIMAKELASDELVVSFLNLPNYTDDGEILQKLRGWGGGGNLPD